MTWILLEGLDRTFKSTLASLLAQRGFQVVHLSAPDKKYQNPTYVGPSYLDEMVEMLSQYHGQNVVFDRTWYGERIWPYVYKRTPQLSAEDYQVLSEFEAANNAVRILMHDPNVGAHWQRCVANNEPLTMDQFRTAHDYFKLLTDEAYVGAGSVFMPATKDDVDSGKIWAMMGMNDGDERPTVDSLSTEGGGVGSGNDASCLSQTKPCTESQKEKSIDITSKGTAMTPEQKKLMEANAINEVLSARIIKKKGEHFDAIEEKLRAFLNAELATLLGMPQPKVEKGGKHLTDEEVMFVRLLMKKTGGKNG